MRLQNALTIAASGLSAQRVRVNAAASNLANAESTRSSAGGPYRRMDPVFESVPSEEGGGVRASVKEDQGPGRAVFLPDHPDADEAGMVTLPDVNPIHEVVNLMSARRGFEANVASFQTAKTLTQRALDLVK